MGWEEELTTPCSWGKTSFQRRFVEFENLEIAFFETDNPPGPLGLAEDNLAKKVVGSPSEGLS